MIFQDPLTSLDPTKTIGYQVGEPVRLKSCFLRAIRSMPVQIPARQYRGSCPILSWSRATMIPCLRRALSGP